MIKLSQQAIVELFVEKLIRLGCRKTTRTVNAADPTEVTTIEGEVGMLYGFGLSTQCEPPDPQVVNVKVIETPWGTDVAFTTSDSSSVVVWQGAYLDDDNKWHRMTGEDFFKQLQRLIIEAVKASEVIGLLEADDETDICGLCGDRKPKGHSCICFDNHCQ